MKVIDFLFAGSPKHKHFPFYFTVSQIFIMDLNSDVMCQQYKNICCLVPV